MDSTKKVCKKLQGTAANTASWATNVGNERGEVLMSMLIESEGTEGTPKHGQWIDEGAGVPPPQVIYTDRDCCSISGSSKYRLVFHYLKYY